MLKRAFTLIELLVVIAILAIMAAIIYPAIVHLTLPTKEVVIKVDGRENEYIKTVQKRNGMVVTEVMTSNQPWSLQDGKYYLVKARGKETVGLGDPPYREVKQIVREVSESEVQ